MKIWIFKKGFQYDVTGWQWIKHIAVWPELELAIRHRNSTKQQGLFAIKSRYTEMPSPDNIFKLMSYWQTIHRDIDLQYALFMEISQAYEQFNTGCICISQWFRSLAIFAYLWREKVNTNVTFYFTARDIRWCDSIGNFNDLLPPLALVMHGLGSEILFLFWLGYVHNYSRKI